MKGEGKSAQEHGPHETANEQTKRYEKTARMCYMSAK